MVSAKTKRGRRSKRLTLAVLLLAAARSAPAESFAYRPTEVYCNQAMRDMLWIRAALNERAMAAERGLVPGGCVELQALKNTCLDILRSFVDTSREVNGTYNNWFATPTITTNAGQITTNYPSTFPMLTATGLLQRVGAPTNYFGCTPAPFLSQVPRTDQHTQPGFTTRDYGLQTVAESIGAMSCTRTPVSAEFRNVHHYAVDVSTSCFSAVGSITVGREASGTGLYSDIGNGNLLCTLPQSFGDADCDCALPSPAPTCSVIGNTATLLAQHRIELYSEDGYGQSHDAYTEGYHAGEDSYDLRTWSDMQMHRRSCNASRSSYYQQGDLVYIWPTKLVGVVSSSRLDVAFDIYETAAIYTNSCETNRLVSRAVTMTPLCDEEDPTCVSYHCEPQFGWTELQNCRRTVTETIDCSGNQQHVETVDGVCSVETATYIRVSEKYLGHGAVYSLSRTLLPPVEPEWFAEAVRAEASTNHAFSAYLPVTVNDEYRLILEDCPPSYNWGYTGSVSYEGSTSLYDLRSDKTISVGSTLGLVRWAFSYRSIR